MYYVDAYNISVKGAIDKNDIVDAMISVRTSLGCLPTANEAYYRKHRVPKHSSLSGSPSGQSASARARNFFGRAAPHNPPPTSFNPSSNTSGNGPRTYNTTSSRSRPFPRPDLDPSYDEPPETRYRTYTPRPAQSGGARTRATSGPSSPSAGQPAYGQWPRPSPGHSRTSSFSRPHNTAGRPAQPAYTPPSPPPPPPPPPRAPAASTSPTPAASAPPSLETLLTQSRSAIAALSVGTLKKILWEARVRMPPGVCEKEDLVERVWALLEEERREGVHNNNGSGAEDYSGDGITITAEEDEHLSSSGDHVQHDSSDFNQATFIDDDHPSTPDMARSVRSRPPTPHLSSPSSGKGKERPNHPVETERGGLCVVCQDDEANIAIVDCGCVIPPIQQLL
ncbi:hypothetical protein ID866_3859 [Astraeus odoratus]|nr:hypothetical protein ID866_3859 [Astraeus odoratus]